MPLRIIRRGTGSVVTWRRAQMVLLSAQGMPLVKIAEVSFTSDDRVRDVIHNFNTDGFDSLYPKYKGGRPRTFTLPERREIKKIAKSEPTEHDLPFSTWSLSKPADFLVAEGVIDDISHKGLRILLREEGEKSPTSTYRAALVLAGCGRRARWSRRVRARRRGRCSRDGSAGTGRTTSGGNGR